MIIAVVAFRDAKATIERLAGEGYVLVDSDKRSAMPGRTALVTRLFARSGEEARETRKRIHERARRRAGRRNP